MKIFSVFAAEYKQIFKDAGTLLILVLAPIFYSFFYPFPYENEIVRKIPVAVIDNDRSDLSRKITRMLDSTEFMAITTEYASLAEAKNAFYDRKIHGIINIPDNFYGDVLHGKQPAVTLFSDGSYMLFYSETFSTAMKVVLTTAAGVKIQRMTMAGIPSGAALKLQSAANVIQKPLYNTAGGYGSFAVPGVMALILQQIILVAMLLVQGRNWEKGLCFVSGAGVVGTLFGKTLAYLSFFMVIAFYFFEVSLRLFHIPDFSASGQLALFILPYGLSVIFLGIAAGHLAREREGGVFFVIMTSIPLLFLSGFSWPVWEMPECVQWLRAVFPSSSGIMGVIMIRQMGASVSDILPLYINLWCLTVIYMIMALFSLHYQMKREKNTPI